MFGGKWTDDGDARRSRNNVKTLLAEGKIGIVQGKCNSTVTLFLSVNNKMYT